MNYKLTFRIFVITFCFACLIPYMLMVFPEHGVLSLHFLGALTAGGLTALFGWCMMVSAIRTNEFMTSVDREDFIGHLVNDGKSGFEITGCEAVSCVRYPLGLTRIFEGEKNLDYTHAVFCRASDGSTHSARIRIYTTTFGDEFNCPIGEWLMKAVTATTA